MPSSYFSSILILKFCWPFTLARLDTLPSAILCKWYKSIPFQQCLCLCRNGSVESLSFCCTLFLSPLPLPLIKEDTYLINFKKLLFKRAQYHYFYLTRTLAYFSWLSPCFCYHFLYPSFLTMVEVQHKF